MTTNTPACGWDQAVFRCGRCGALLPLIPEAFEQRQAAEGE
ncbi:hypothetical protein AB0J03_34405 [Streptomyces microflavus]